MDYRTLAISLRHLIAGGACAVAMCAAAAPPDAAALSHKDWEIRCDNTLTCRAAGYQSDSGESAPVSMRVVRRAGPGTLPEVELQLSADEPVKGNLLLKVGKFTLRQAASDWLSFTPAQARAVLPELLTNDEATVSVGSQSWTLSLEGANAVLLKMDEVQRRLGTPGAIVRRGNRPESSVRPAVAPPVVRNVVPVETRPGDAALAAAIFPQLDLTGAIEQCNGFKADPARFEINRLTASKVLVSLGCGVGAYNFLTMNWRANDRPPFQPEELEADGEFSPDGSMTSAMKVRGVGDCWSSRTWQFDGRDFVLVKDVVDTLCRGFAGGAWQLESYTATLAKPPASGNKKSK